jgi:hypothetical protein
MDGTDKGVFGSNDTLPNPHRLDADERRQSMKADAVPAARCAPGCGARGEGRIFRAVPGCNRPGVARDGVVNIPHLTKEYLS